MPITVQELNQLIVGSSVRGINATHTDVFAKTSDDFHLTITSEGSEPVIRVQTHGLTSHYRLQIGGFRSSSPTAVAIERRIWSLRQLYAIVFLVHAGRTQEIPSGADSFDLDLEDMLLSKEEALQISDLGIGSLWTTVRNWTDHGRKAIVTLAAFFISEARENLIRRLRAQTRGEELNTMRKELDLEFDKANKIIDLVHKIERIKDPDERRIVKDLLAKHTHDLDLPELPPPDDKSIHRK
jgi:hypothetical protein